MAVLLKTHRSSYNVVSYIYGIVSQEGYLCQRVLRKD